MTQTQAATAETCDQFLRQAREFLAQEDLASASAAGWRAAVLALEAHTGHAIADNHFRENARRLVKDRRAHANAAEWVISAITLSENVEDDWLDRSGIRRRLDDVQRLVNLVFDIANPPQDGEALLRRAWACLANGSLAVASEKGWEAATYSAKAYATAMGHGHIRSNYVSQVTRLLKEEPGGNQVGNWSMSASMLHENAIADPDWLDLEITREDLQGVSKLVSFIRECIEFHGNSGKLPNV